MAEETSGAEGMQVDTDLVRQIAELLKDSDLTEIEVQDGVRRIVVKRNVTAAAAPVYAPAPQAAPAAPSGAPSSPPPSAAASEPGANHPGVVKSPMVGTVYLAGEPGAKPFVSPGARVSEGETIVIIEAMKVMNPIAAPRSGTVTQIFVDNGQPVEFDQPLVVIE